MWNIRKGELAVNIIKWLQAKTRENNEIKNKRIFRGRKMKG